LLSNAEKYCGNQKEIEIRLEAKADCAEVTVLDRGIGVPKGCEEKIFEQFYRAQDSLNSGIQGSGLGLTLARQIARAHGGEVMYEAREGGGSVFRLRVPRE
jgi:signal transduction histidine kinase